MAQKTGLELCGVSESVDLTQLGSQWVPTGAVLFFCVPIAAAAAEEVAPHCPGTVIDFEVRVPLKFRRVLTEFLQNRVANCVLDVLDAIIIVTDVLGSRAFDVGDTALQFCDRCFRSRRRF
jgi:hypothetical protein